MDPDRPLSAEEKRQQLKEQYKRELLDHRNKMRQLANARRLREIEHTLRELESGPVSHADNILARMEQRNAEADARLDMALDNVASSSPLHSLPTRTLGDEELIPPRPSEDAVQASQLAKTLGDEELIPPRPSEDAVQAPPPTKTLGDEEA